MENWMADNGWVFKGLAYCKTLARETQGCAGPELIQWQELLSTRVCLGLPEVRILLSLSFSIGGASLAEICDLLSQQPAVLSCRRNQLRGARVAALRREG